LVYWTPERQLLRSGALSNEREAAVGCAQVVGASSRRFDQALVERNRLDGLGKQRSKMFIQAAAQMTTGLARIECLPVSLEISLCEIAIEWPLPAEHEIQLQAVEQQGWIDGLLADVILQPDQDAGKKKPAEGAPVCTVIARQHLVGLTKPKLQV